MTQDNLIVITDHIPFTQTTRQGWIAAMTPDQLLGIVPPREQGQLNMLTDTNRPISEPHAKAIAQFIQDTPNWALPGIILAAPPGSISQDANKAILVPRDQVRVLDGQHRIHALGQIISRGTTEEHRSLNASQIPIAIFEVHEDTDQQQMFAWFARNKPIEAATRELFDYSDPFNNVARHAIDNATVLTGRVNTQVSRTNPDRDQYLLTLTELKNVAAAIAIGVRNNPKKQDQARYWQDEALDGLKKAIITFFDEFLPTCGSQYHKLLDQEPQHDQFNFDRRGTYHLHPQTIRLLANCWARVAQDTGQSTSRLARHVAGMNLEKANPTNDFQEMQLIKEGKDSFQTNNHIVWTNATSTILKAAQQE